jgi:hypothetical protein
MKQYASRIEFSNKLPQVHEALVFVEEILGHRINVNNLSNEEETKRLIDLTKIRLNNYNLR